MRYQINPEKQGQYNKKELPRKDKISFFQQVK